MNVSVRELRLKLSEYVRRARAGESFVVTNRGRPIARLTRDPRDADGRTLREPRAAYIAVPEDIPVEEERVGVRALKASMPSALQLIAGGKEITVTDRGAPVARLQPVAGDVASPPWLTPDQAARVATALELDPPPMALWPLIREGRLIWKGRFRLDELPPPVELRPDPDGKTVADLVSDMRDEGW